MGWRSVRQASQSNIVAPMSGSPSSPGTEIAAGIQLRSELARRGGAERELPTPRMALKRVTHQSHITCTHRRKAWRVVCMCRPISAPCARGRGAAAPEPEALGAMGRTRRQEQRGSPPARRGAGAARSTAPRASGPARPSPLHIGPVRSEAEWPFQGQDSARIEN